MEHLDAELAAQSGTGKLSWKGYLQVVILLMGLPALGYGGYAVWEEQRYTESTSDAYVAGNIVQITPQVDGTVVGIHVENTDFVRAGQTLVKLDDTDAELSLKQAEAALAQTLRETGRLFANIRQLEAMVAVRKAELEQIQEDLQRRERLRGSGHISNEALEHVQLAERIARDKLRVADTQLTAERVLTRGASPGTHPLVQQAITKVKNAYLSYARTTVVAPVSGYVEKRYVQLGQRVVPGAPLMAVVPLDQLWVEANFKEVQLRNMRIGQTVKLVADLYGNRVEYHGQLAGIGVGTGSVFSLLPPQNATGNWIKIVQRVPVRIAINTDNVKQFPLRLGLSMEVNIDTENRSGAVLTNSTDSKSVHQTAVYDQLTIDADTRIKLIMVNNFPISDQHIMANSCTRESRVLASIE